MLICEGELPYPGHTGNTSVRHGGGRHYLSKEALAYRAAVRMKVNPRGDKVLIHGPVRVEWLIAPPDRRARDFDNLSKNVSDALTHAGFWADDSNKVIVAGSYQWTEPLKGGRIHLSVFQV